MPLHQIMPVDGKRPSRRLDHKQDRLILNRQPVSPPRVRFHDVPSIGDEDAWDSLIARSAHAAPIAIVEDDALRKARPRRRRQIGGSGAIAAKQRRKADAGGEGGGSS
ncbi:hypothetical protein CCAX7_20110 [Capsulimonas corticalis]|uniref:Uncharacterized protein n=1 Tax=Capsulimonas corticalis TaxID=2219043 RepID=A0A402D2M0_9BACT|nr:hypothetical protein CCAX7_20110 [Capsulimonas corticalis]